MKVCWKSNFKASREISKFLGKGVSPFPIPPAAYSLASVGRYAMPTFFTKMFRFFLEKSLSCLIKMKKKHFVFLLFLCNINIFQHGTSSIVALLLIYTYSENFMEIWCQGKILLTNFIFHDFSNVHRGGWYLWTHSLSNFTRGHLKTVKKNCSYKEAGPL